MCKVEVENFEFEEKWGKKAKEKAEIVNWLKQDQKEMRENFLQLVENCEIIERRLESLEEQNRELKRLNENLEERNVELEQKLVAADHINVPGYQETQFAEFSASSPVDSSSASA